MEVAGLVLGAVPIVLQALKQYQTLYRLCKRFKRCENGIQELLVCLKLQRVIFENESRLLLAGALGADRAKAMINDLQHPLWQDPSAMNRVSRLLGESKEAIIMSGLEVQSRMKRFEEELQKLEVHDSATGQMQGKTLRKEIRKRFRFTFSESKLGEVTESITQATKEYRVLRSQVQELARQKPEPENDALNVETIERATATREAAKHIYNLLTAACTLHAKHHAQFSLKPQYDPHGNGTGVRFQIAYRHLSRHQARGSHDVLWFVVESLLTGTLSKIPSTISSRNAVPPGKRARSPSIVEMRGTIETTKKRVRFSSPPPCPSSNTVSASTSQCSTSPVGYTTTSLNLPNLGTATDFCTQLRTCCQQGHSSNVCIALLEQCRVYPSKGPQEQIVTHAPETLSDVLISARNRQSMSTGLPLLQRLELARLLTTAVLNFHSTPWMQSSWKSDDIFLYDTSLSDARSAGRDLDAFVEVPVDQQINSNFDILAPYVRNSTLFSLAVILIELAFEKPFIEMVEVTDARPGDPRVLVEVNAAMRLSAEVSTCLGPRYAKLVEQCLFCAFGQGTDLENPALQGAIQKDIVSELDRLAGGFRNLIL